MGFFDRSKKLNSDIAPLSSSEKLDRPTPSSEELLIQSVQKFRMEMQNVTDKFLIEHEQNLSDSKRRIENAEKFMRDTKLDRYLPYMLAEMWSWPSWSKRDDAGKYILNDISEISGEDTKSGSKETKIITFVYDDTRYKLTFEKDKWSSAEQYQFGTISLHHKEREIVKIKVSQDFDDIYREYYDWEYMSVESLEIGSWVMHVVEIAEKLKLDFEKKLRGTNQSESLNRRKNYLKLNSLSDIGHFCPPGCPLHFYRFSANNEKVTYRDFHEKAYTI